MCGAHRKGLIVKSSYRLNEDYIDVNGDKEPNMLGRDLFTFSISDSGKFTEAYNDWFCANKLEAQYLDNECFYKKIVSDGWKMDY